MLIYVTKRILQIIPVVLIISLLVFLMIHLMPGDPVEDMLGIKVSQEIIEAVREELGLNDPLHIQFFNYIKGLLKGDLGTSLHTKKPVLEEIKARYPYTLKLAIGATLVSAGVGIILGVLAAIKHNKFLDNFIMVISMLAVSTPAFFLALVLILIFSLRLGWLPSIGLKSASHYVLPIITLGAPSIGVVARTTRSAMLDVLGQDYIRTSRSRGISENVIIFSHALKNALIPVVTVIGLRFGGLLAGATLTETVFSIPGMGRFLVEGVLKRDYPVIQSTILLLALTFVIVNMVVDILYGLIDPRIRYE